MCDHQIYIVCWAATLRSGFSLQKELVFLLKAVLNIKAVTIPPDAVTEDSYKNPKINYQQTSILDMKTSYLLKLSWIATHYRHAGQMKQTIAFYR